MFEIHSEDIEQLETVREFNIWLYAIDDAIHIENVDALVEYLIGIERPEFVMAALDFKHKYLTDEN